MKNAYEQQFLSICLPHEDVQSKLDNLLFATQMIADSGEEVTHVIKDLLGLYMEIQHADKQREDGREMVIDIKETITAR